MSDIRKDEIIEPMASVGGKAGDGAPPLPNAGGDAAKAALASVATAIKYNLAFTLLLPFERWG
jgi:hypothetical protein